MLLAKFVKIRCTRKISVLQYHCITWTVCQRGQEMLNTSFQLDADEMQCFKMNVDKSRLST